MKAEILLPAGIVLVLVIAGVVFCVVRRCRKRTTDTATVRTSFSYEQTGYIYNRQVDALTSTRINNFDLITPQRHSNIYSGEFMINYCQTRTLSVKL